MPDEVLEEVKEEADGEATGERGQVQVHAVLQKIDAINMKFSKL